MEIITLGLSEATRSLELRHDPFDSPMESINSPANWAWFYGGQPTASGELISEHNALTVSAVYSCVSYISNAIAALPLELWEETSDGTGRMKAFDHPLWSLLAEEPNPEMTSVTFLRAMALSLCLFGNSYAEIERNGLLQPVAFWPLDARKTKPVRINNQIVYETKDEFHSDDNTLTKTRYIKSADMLHVPLLCFDGLKGISPIAASRESFGLAQALQKYGARTVANGSNPQGVLVNKSLTKPTPQQLKEMQDSWQALHAGMNAGKIGILGGDWDFKQTGMSNEDAQYLLSREFQREEIAAIFHIDSSLLWNKGRANATSREQINIGFVTDTLHPYLVGFESEIRRKLLPSVGRKAGLYFAKFDVSERLRGDFKSQMDGYQAGVIGGWYSPNEVRRKLGENPGPPELDVYRVPVNYQNAERLLDTESLQDQPVDADPDAESDAPATDAERKMLDSYDLAYIRLYRDAFNRLMKRNKRDYVTISSLFQPILASIADMAISYRGFESTQVGQSAENIVNDALKAMAKRATKWPEAIAESDMPTYVGVEFKKAVRTIHIGVYKDMAAAVAKAEIED